MGALFSRPFRSRLRLRLRLLTIGVRPSIGHTQRVGSVMLQIIPKFILKVPSPETLPARTVAQWISRLEHELLDDTMEGDIVVVPFSRESNKVLDGLVHFVGEETQLDITQRRVQDSRRGDIGL